MACTQRPPESAVTAMLQERPETFDFPAAVEALLQTHPQGPQAALAALAEGRGPRLQSDPRPIFPASPVTNGVHQTDQWKLTVAVGGILTLTEGLSPEDITALRRQAHADGPEAAARLARLDHQWLAAHHVAWADAPHLTYARRKQAEQAGLPDSDALDDAEEALRCAQMLLRRAGLLEQMRDVPADVAVRYLGLLLPPARPPAALAAILTDYLGTPATVDWRETSAATALAPTIASILRMRIGPLTFRQFQTFIGPNSSVLRTTLALARLFLKDASEVEIVLVVKAAETPCCRLNDSAARLNYCAWLAPNDGQARETDVEMILDSTLCSAILDRAPERISL